MLEHPMYVELTTENNQPYFENPSCAETIISAMVVAQDQGWLRLHGFVVLPFALYLAISPIRQNVSGVIAHLQSEMMPILSVLLPEALMIWTPHYVHHPLVTQNVFNARLQMMMLSPVAYNLAESPEEYTFSSANPRYNKHVTLYGGFAGGLPPDDESLITGVNPVIADKFDLD